MRSTHFLAFLIGLAAFGVTRPLEAQVKPYILIVFDTSGSMADTVTPMDDCGFGTTKLSHAKCAINQVLQSTGDAQFGFMQFDQKTDPPGAGCSPGNANGGGVCSPNSDSAWLREQIQTNNAQSILSLVDNTGVAPAQDLCPGGYTPLGGSLQAARKYFEGTFSQTRGGAQSFDGPTADDDRAACRGLNVILLTDGMENCGTGNPTGNAPAEATSLRSITVPTPSGAMAKEVRTFVIGFGIAAGDAAITAIANAGGTTAFFPSNQKGLSAALSAIIAEAQPAGESCNCMDDDCDGLIDEGVPKFCDIPNGITDPDRCEAPPDDGENGLCEEPDETNCDGIDDDCDGVLDEGLLNRCGQCGDEPPEICDGKDNDCDTRIDESASSGDACGNMKGICMPGQLVCIDGDEVCQGEVGPDEEVCDCKDNDCDGFTDENIDGSLCPDGQPCVACMCVPYCQQTPEFQPFCPTGLTPEKQDNGECICIIDQCDPVECAKSEIERDGTLACAPDRDDMAECFCQGGQCGANCDGRSCSSGEICSKKTGRCVEENCRGLGCPDGERCNLATAECESDPCEDVDCDDGEVCRDGDCEKSCADVSCGAGKSCRSGRCEDDPCAGVSCEGGEVCDPDEGECVESQCGGVSCADYQVCNGVTGTCEVDPCWELKCPSGQFCRAGECSKPTKPQTEVVDTRRSATERIFATGGSGCTCRVAGSARGNGAFGWLGALCALGIALRLGRRRRTLALALGVALLSLWLGACKVTPYCVNCDEGSAIDPDKVDSGPSSPFEPGGDGDTGDGDTGDGDTGDGDTGDADGEPQDAGMDAGPNCEPKPETCNDRDDDCDFKVDEGVKAPQNPCNQKGVCAGTTPVCLQGEFVCRYDGDAYQDDEKLCDGLDNDCDGLKDEGFDQLGKGCKEGVGACEVTGRYACNDKGDDVVCTVQNQPEASQEVCDNVDNDCDGLVDEPESNPGSNDSYVVDDLVAVGSGLWVYRYEASRVDASDKGAGKVNARACSQAGVLPWTDVTYEEAVAACQAADLELCTAAQWKSACEGDGTSACAWGATSGGACADLSASPALCNGHDVSSTPGGVDNDGPVATGSLTSCYAEHGGEAIFDLSGNAKEWVTGSTDSAAKEQPVRGGAYNDLSGGLRCDFDFARAYTTVRLPSVGFRCCKTN